MITPIWLIVLAVIVGGAGYLWYVALIRRRNKALEALSSIDVQLRKRHDLLPNVLKLANQYMTHERDLISRVTELRNKAQVPYNKASEQDVEKHLQAEGALQAGVKRIFAVAENYPDLKSSESIIQAQQTFNEVEGHIAASRRFYNSAVASLNNSIQIFPGSTIADLAHIEPMPFFEIEGDAVREPVDADDFISVPGTSGGKVGAS